MIHLTSDLEAVIGEGAQHCVSRSLMADRFVFKDQQMSEANRIALDTFVTGGLARLRYMRERWGAVLSDKKSKPQDQVAAQRKLDATDALNARTHEVEVSTKHSEAWLHFLHTGLRVADEQVLLGKLQARLLVNMAGGVMENAGLCLDRFSGLPVIPGSAVKGCARRAAMQKLLLKAVDDSQVSTDDVAALLGDIAMGFGWTDSEWRAGRKRERQGDRTKETEAHSDFWWAMASDSGDQSADAQRNALWSAVSEKCAESLFKALRVEPDDASKPLARQLPSFAGAVSFLPAWPLPVQDGASLAEAAPPLGSLDLDVLTCHHGKYYLKTPPAYEPAADTEEPNPVLFPAVAAGHVFAFVLRPIGAERSSLSRPKGALHQLALDWLREGLATSGIGAKTAAGYGWFEDCTSRLKPWWQLAAQVARLREAHLCFAAYPPEKKDDLVLELADKLEACRAWAQMDSDSFNPINKYALSQQIRLL